MHQVTAVATIARSIRGEYGEVRSSMKRLIWSLVALVMISTFPPIPSGAAAGGLSDRFAHPPIHVRGKAKTSPISYTPSQIRQAYGLNNVTSDGSGQVIAIVDAYDDPTIANDLQAFIKTHPSVARYDVSRKCYVSIDREAR